MDAMHLNPADQNDGAATEIVNPSEDEKHPSEEPPREDANYEGGEREPSTRH